MGFSCFWYGVGLFGGSGKKTAGAARNHTRKALADKTNESPTSSSFTPSPMKLKEGDRVSYKGTPYPKLLHDIQKATVSPPVLLHKVETAEEYSLHRMPKTPGELVAPTPTNTPISILPFRSSCSFSHRALPTTPSSGNVLLSAECKQDHGRTHSCKQANQCLLKLRSQCPLPDDRPACGL